MTNTRIYFLIFAIFLVSNDYAQEPNAKIKVYLLGTFHFGDTDTTIFDIKSKENQVEVQKLCNKICKLNPDKVFIERQPDFEYQNKMDSLYQAFRAGDSIRRRNEIWQIAFRVANQLNHSTIYQCDHPGNYGTLYDNIEQYAKQHNQLNILNYTAKGTTKPMHLDFNRDSLYKANKLIDILKLLNSKEYQGKSHASYINVYPQIGNTNVFNYDSTYLMGSELTADWYRRNIKIYTKMINQLDYTEKSIFLLMGNDHIPIIKHLFESNPYFEVIDTQNWLWKTKIKIGK